MNKKKLCIIVEGAFERLDCRTIDTVHAAIKDMTTPLDRSKEHVVKNVTNEDYDDSDNDAIDPSMFGTFNEY